ncbi:hypothetical protein Ddye_000534 [Dipteronia dyeriana]|uniref:RNase H type-1 domain-containing protein n=1 Tax=Dipteronia dyeriana TaxID=168575 RepID=A0AAE0CSG4_9ROSI|nr:hypothetical protein Ddye_000534 [Dipteronia dyeriana]
MIFAKDCGFKRLVVESDALGVVNMINSGTEVSADIGEIIEDIRRHLHNMIGAKFANSKRMLLLIPYQKWP